MRCGIPRAYGSWAEPAAGVTVDVVDVATPHSARWAAAGLCLEAGKAVRREKAFTPNLREAEGLVDLAHDRGLFLMEAMWTYGNPLIRHLVAHVAGGRSAKSVTYRPIAASAPSSRPSTP